jgi:K+-sensing histidine kinase KdpD
VSRALHVRVGLLACVTLEQVMDGRIRGHGRAAGGARFCLALPISDKE